MINTVLAGFEKLRRYKDFYFGLNPEALQFYQLGEGYLTAFSQLYRQAQDGHYLHQPPFAKTVASPLKVGARLMTDHALFGKKALHHAELDGTLLAIGLQMATATAIIASSDEGLYLAATLYNKTQSFDSYRAFVDLDVPLTDHIDTWFDEASSLCHLLKTTKGYCLNHPLANYTFSDYQGYRAMMNRLYVLVNKGLYIVERAGVELSTFLTAIHQHHLDQCWTLTKAEKRHFFQCQQWDINQYVFMEVSTGRELAYHLETEQPLLPPMISSPELDSARAALARKMAEDRISYGRAGGGRERRARKEVAKGISVIESSV